MRVDREYNKWFFNQEFIRDHLDTDFSTDVRMEARLQRHEW